MHLLTISSRSLDDIAEPVDLGQPPGDMVVLSFAETDLAALAAAWASERTSLPTLRLANLRDLRHPLSVDLWTDRVAAHAKVIVVRLLGGLEWWRYGIDRLSLLARERGIALAVLPGEDCEDPRMADVSTLPPHELQSLLGFFREGGCGNLAALLRRLARHAGHDLDAPQPESKPLPRMAAYLPGKGAVALDTLTAALRPGAPVIPVIFYRSLLLAADTGPIDVLYETLQACGLAPAPLFVTSLKEQAAADFIRAAMARLAPSVIVTTTAFAAGVRAEDETPFASSAPVLQAVIATTKRTAWQESPRGLGAADLAMHVVLPELDGRVLAGAIAFKHPLPAIAGLAFTAMANRPEPNRVEMLARRIAALVHLQNTPRVQRGIAVLMPDYPGAAGRAGYAVGLDVPASVVSLLADLSAAGYTVTNAPLSARELLDALAPEDNYSALPLADYENMLKALPAKLSAQLHAAWGKSAADPDVRDGAFRFRAQWFGRVLVALPPDRGHSNERRANYHDSTLPPRHALVAFGLWLQHVARIDALVHMGAHGTLEWLPGKAVALSECCFPEAIVGAVPVIYPFIVSNPGEAAQAKRRIAAVTLGHLPPPLVFANLSGEARELERLVDEYAQADGLDRPRRERLARLIVDTAERSGLAREVGVETTAPPDDALRRIDAWLCDLKDLAIKDGLHVFGRPSTAEVCDPAWQACAEAERRGLLASLDGRHIEPGPAGAPARGRRDVLPTGRNLFTADPRMLPTQTAMDLGRLAAEEVVRLYLQQHGEMPRALVMDLWSSATLRTGGEEIAQGFALMGCRPTWDHTTGRVTGVEVLPIAAMGRARVDVTWRISGLFRDLFPAQIALLDAAVRAVAALDEADEDNPLAAAHRTINEKKAAVITRIFGTAPGCYGAGVEEFLGRKAGRKAIGAAYLDATSHSYGGAEGSAAPAQAEFADRVAAADLLIHACDDPGRDLLEGAEDVDFVGGFASAAAALGRAPDLVMLDTTDPQGPRARPLQTALARIVRARAINPRFVEGQMRHGPRGAAELAETVDRLIDFAETTDAVPSLLLDLVYEAYVADPRVREFLLRENPGAAGSIAARFAAAQHQGLWHPRRNDIADDLKALSAEAAS